jgi:hypothetical protein
MRVSEILSFSVVIFLITVVFAGAVTVPAAKKDQAISSPFCSVFV